LVVVIISFKILDMYMNPKPEPVVMHGETFFIEVETMNTELNPVVWDFVVGIGVDIDPVDPGTWLWNWRDRNVTVPPGTGKVVLGGFIMPGATDVPKGTYDLVITYGKLLDYVYALTAFELFENALGVVVWTPPAPPITYWTVKVILKTKNIPEPQRMQVLVERVKEEEPITGWIVGLTKPEETFTLYFEDIPGLATYTVRAVLQYRDTLETLISVEKIFILEDNTYTVIASSIQSQTGEKILVGFD